MMINRSRNAFLWGFVFTLAGIFLLLLNNKVLDPYAPVWQWVVAGVFAISGIGFLIAFLRDVARWWPVIPAFTLLTAGVIVFLTTQTTLSGELLGAILFFGISLAFAVIFLLDRQRWWAIIPSGLLIVLSITTTLTALNASSASLSAVLFIGMGLVFFAVYLLGPQKREVWWAVIPAIALSTFGLFSFVLKDVQGDTLVFLARWWPVLLVIFGLFVLVRGFVLLNGRTLPAAMTNSADDVFVAPPTATLQPLPAVETQKITPSTVAEIDEPALDDATSTNTPA